MPIAVFIIIISIVFGLARIRLQRSSKIINDVQKYKNIDQVIKKFGAPDSVTPYEDYKKYVFKRAASGWTWNKYVVDVFTTKNGKIIKHEHFQE